MNYFPIFADLHNRVVLVVGAGTVAQRKIEALLLAGAKIRVIAANLSSKLENLLIAKQLEWVSTEFNESLLDDAYLVVAATNDAELNHRVFQAAEMRHILTNVVDSPNLCSFIVPSIIDRGAIQIAISSGGKAPVLARLLREKLETLLPQGLATMAQIAARWRHIVKQRYTNLSQRRRFWEKLFTTPKFLYLSETQQNADDWIQEMLDEKLPETGCVSLVGAGPGDAGLLTLKGLQRIQEADVVLYDALVSTEVLELIRRDAEKIFVGKRAGKHSSTQEEINQLLIELAQQGKRVVRLKGGDSFIFGRGGEELEALHNVGIPFEVVPGITAALGASAYAGIPLTHRDYAQSVMMLTACSRSNGNDIAWHTLAKSNQTLAVYMGKLQATKLAQELLQHGRSANTPVAVISRATLPDQQVLVGKLCDLHQLADSAPSPALVVIGETVALHQKLAWFGQQSTAFSERKRQFLQAA